jgi:hypothetical protein
MTDDEYQNAVAGLGLLMVSLRPRLARKSRDDLDGCPGFVLQRFDEARVFATGEVQLLDFSSS